MYSVLNDMITMLHGGTVIMGTKSLDDTAARLGLLATWFLEFLAVKGGLHKDGSISVPYH
jgi:hypothetical protein